MNILITGAAGGIARKVIDKIKSREDHIWVTVHTDAQLERAKKKYENNSHIQCMKLDITNSKDREKLKKMDIDVLLCNAAIGEGGSLAEMDMERVRHNFEVNVFSNFTCVQIVLKNMIKKGRGRIVLMSSLAGIVPVPFLGSYCATKASIIKIFETLRLELTLIPEEIDVICIEPGLYATGFNKVMFENKYPEMEKGSYFAPELAIIRARETFLLKLFERKKLDGIACKIEKAIYQRKPKKVYKDPYIQALFAKFYFLFFE